MSKRDVASSAVWKMVQEFASAYGTATARFNATVKQMAAEKLALSDILKTAQGEKDWPMNPKNGKPYGLGTALEKGKTASVVSFATFERYWYKSNLDLTKNGVPQLKKNGEIKVKAAKAATTSSGTAPAKTKWTVEKTTVQEFLDKAVADKRLADASYRKALVDILAALQIEVSVPAGK